MSEGWREKRERRERQIGDRERERERGWEGREEEKRGRNKREERKKRRSREEKERARERTHRQIHTDPRRERERGAVANKPAKYLQAHISSRNSKQKLAGATTAAVAAALEKELRPQNPHHFSVSLSGLKTKARNSLRLWFRLGPHTCCYGNQIACISEISWLSGSGPQ